MLVANLFYKVTHTEEGQPKLHERTAGLGMSAALLAELVISGHLDVQDDKILVVPRQPAPEDVLAHRVLDDLIRERADHPLRDWLAYLGRTAETDVAERMVRSGELVKVTRGFRRRVFYQPVDGTNFAAAYAHLSMSLMQVTRLPDWTWAWCAGLCFATGLHKTMLDSDPQSDPRQYLVWLVGKLPAPGRDLVHATVAAIEAAVMTPR